MHEGPLGLRAPSLPELTVVLSSVSHQDWFVSGAVLAGVEQHEVAARGAFDPDGKRQVIIVILAERQNYAAAAAEMRDYLKFAPEASDAAEVRSQIAQLEASAKANQGAPPQ